MFLGWFSGAVAGLTALLYGFGFLATVAHQGMLGLDWASSTRETLWYLGLGGQVVAFWTLQATVALLLVLACGEALLWVVRRLKREGVENPNRWVRAVRWFDRNLIWFLAALSLVLVGAMMDAFGGALGLDDLLFAPAAELCTGEGTRAEIVFENRAALSDRAGTIAFFAAIALGVGGYAVPRLAAGQGPAVPLLIFIAVAIQALGAIPTAYGLFVLKTGFRSLSGEGAVFGTVAPDSLHLVARTRDGLWAWEPAERNVYWLSSGSYTSLRIGAASSIGALACP